MLGITNAVNERSHNALDSNTILLFTDDLVEKTGTCTFTNNGVVVSTTQKRDGRNTLLFSRPNNAYLQASAANLSAAVKSVFNGMNPWTFECWFYLLSGGSAGTCMFHYKNTASVAYGTIIGHYGSHVNADLYVSSNTSSWNILQNTLIWRSIEPCFWNHYAVCKNSNGVFTGYINGVLTYTSAKTTGTPPNLTDGQITIGGYVAGANTAAPSCIWGYFQDIRLSNTNRYISDFTPPQRII